MLIGHAETLNANKNGGAQQLGSFLPSAFCHRHNRGAVCRVLVQISFRLWKLSASKVSSPSHWHTSRCGKKRSITQLLCCTLLSHRKVERTPLNDARLQLPGSVETRIALRCFFPEAVILYYTSSNKSALLAAGAVALTRTADEEHLVILHFWRP